MRGHTRGADTIFDDVLAHCRFTYAQHAEQLRRDAARQAEEARRQAAEDTSRRAGAGAQASWGRHGRGSASKETSQDPKYTRPFENMQEARLSLHLARLHLGSRGDLRSSSKGEQWHVELSPTVSVREEVNLAFRRALHELQLAAMDLRVEAARVRDEAIRRAQKECEAQSAQSFRTAVDAYVKRAGYPQATQEVTLSFARKTHAGAGFRTHWTPALGDPPGLGTSPDTPPGLTPPAGRRPSV